MIPRETLTEREKQVLACLVDGMTNPLIAETLGVSIHTVKTHLQGIFTKLGCHSRLEALLMASHWQEGL